MENSSEMYLILLGIIIGVIIGSISAIFFVVSSPSIYDLIASHSVKDKATYCDNYAKWIDFRIPLKPEEAVDTEIAKTICKCWWEEWPDNQMYKGITRCEVRGWITI